MIKKIFKAIENIESVYEDSKEIEKEDDKVFATFKKYQDPEVVGTELFYSFEEILAVFSRPLHFNNLYTYHNAVLYLTDHSKLNTLIGINTKTKVALQKSLKTLTKKIHNVYETKMQEACWRDEIGLIGCGVSKTQDAVENMINKYVIHIPHAGLQIPEEFRGDYYLSDVELEKNIKEYADYKADKLYGELLKKYEGVVSPYSRLFMDPERFFDDTKEQMQVKHSLGWFYENAILDKKPLRSTKNKDKIAKYYHQHHEKLTTLVEERLELFGECVIVDCHTFSNTRYWFHDKTVDLPDACLGYDEFHKDNSVIQKMCKAFKDISINTPYAGSLVPSKYYMKDSRVKSVMIEINKKLYLDEENVTVSNKFIPSLT